jgi:hypothetical protein
MQNFTNDNYYPDVNYFQQFADPALNEPFNRATHPADKPIISKHIFALDSRQRDYKLYPNANNYNIKIPDRYRNVTAIELKAAMLPRTEYNVNSSNKYLDFSIGDYISDIKIIGPNVITNIGVPYGEATNVPLKIEAPILPGGISAEITVDIDKNSKIIAYNYIIQGSGYSYSNPPKISIGDFSDFTVTIGTLYTATLREGQYVIGGNPQFTNQTSSTPRILQSWVPSNLLCEIENAISYAIFGDNELGYCYTRQPWITENSGSVTNTAKDYPLLFTARLMSQYPSIDTYENTGRNQNINFETNSCKFNRIYTTNCLIFRSNSDFVSTGGIITDIEGFEYKIVKKDTINMGPGNTEYILYCKLTHPFSKGTLSNKYWTGLSSVTGYIVELAHWEFLFASGEFQIVNSASLLGYNKKNYYLSTSNIAIEVSHPLATSSPNTTTLIPKGLSYSGENDYYLFGDPEYVILSFRPKYGGNTISGVNDRVDSQPDTNIDRVFACLIYDTVQPAVLQDVSSGKIDATLGSISYHNNTLTSFMNKDNTFHDVKQLTGNSGTQNVSYNKPPGQLKAMKGADFDRKVVEFPQPIAQIFDLNIRFSKFSKLGKGDDKELYNFHGKEHLLLFEITCGDMMTGKRF